MTRPSTGSCSPRTPPGSTQADPGTTITLTVGARASTPVTTRPRPTRRRTRHDARRRDAASASAVLAGGRSSEHDDLARLGDVGRSRRSIRRATTSRRSRSAATAAGRSRAGHGHASSARGAAGTLPVALERVAAGARGGRRRPPDPPRPVRRGRHRPGPARAGGRPVRRLRRDRLGAVHGQGPLQGRAPRPRIPVAAQRDAPCRATRSRTPTATPCSSSRRGSDPRSGSRRSQRGGELEAAVALARRHDDKVLVEEFAAGHGGRVRRARQPRPDRLRGRARSSRTPTGTTTRRSTRRAAWSS